MRPGSGYRFPVELLLFLLLVFVIGLVIGALGRLLVPGPDPMGIGATAIAGIGGALVGGLIAREWLDRTEPGLLIAVLCAAVIVYLVRISRRPKVIGRR